MQMRKQVDLGLGSILMVTGLVSLLGGCAEVFRQPDANRDFVRFAVKVDRLKDVAFPLSVAAAPFCPQDIQPTYGFELHDKSRYAQLPKAEYREAAIEYYKIGDGVSLRYVHPRLPAGLAGLHPRAPVVSLDGEILDNTTAEDAGEIVRRFDRRKEGPLHVVVKDLEIREVDLYSVPACKYPVMLVQSDVVNAFADGTRVIITTGMLDFTANDAELAVVIGHEIAHNALAHIDDLRLSHVLDSLFNAHTGHQAELTTIATGFSFSKEFETQADYMGLYIAARAGYDLSSVGQFWKRIAQRSLTVASPAFSTTHPSYPDRIGASYSTLREISNKLELGDPLLPNIATTRAVRQLPITDRQETDKAILR
jgi:hypothetical protein